MPFLQCEVQGLHPPPPQKKWQSGNYMVVWEILKKQNDFNIKVVEWGRMLCWPMKGSSISSSTSLSLSCPQIKTWFQNRRMKLKRQLQEIRPEPFHAVPFYSPLPFGPQSGPVSYVYSPHQHTFTGREAVPSGIPFPPMPAPTLDPRTNSGGQPGALWPMPMPYFIGCQDPRTVFLPLWVNRQGCCWPTEGFALKSALPELYL